MQSDDHFGPFACLTGNGDRIGSRAAIITPDRQITHGELPDLVLARADTLIELGLDIGQMTAVTIPDEVEHLLTSLALLSLATLNISLGSFEAAETRTGMAKALGVAQTLTFATQPQGPSQGRALILPGSTNATPPDLRQRLLETTIPEDDAIFYRSTSGTTGVPKTFGTTMRLILNMARGLVDDPAKRCVLRTSSVEHDSSRIYQIGAILAGCTAAILDPITADRLAPFCHMAKVTEIHTGTYRLASLLAAPPDPAHKLPKGLRVLTGGSRVSADLRHAVRTRLTPHLWVNYATSEVGVISIAGPEDHDQWPEGVGRPAPGVEIILRDPDGNEVPRGTTGEAWINKPGTKGWLRTGDILSWPKDGPLIFHARVDDMMILNGINIFPGPIEDALAAHPAVAEAVAFAVPSRVHGQIPVAAVVLRHGATATNADLLHHVRELLGLRAPRQIKIVDSIPRTRLGKPKPSALRAGTH